MIDNEPVAGLRYQTRFYATTKADLILPFVLEALRTVGHGSACVVQSTPLQTNPRLLGIQWTAPVDEALLIEAQIKALDKLENLAFQPLVVYPPVMKLKSDLAPDAMQRILTELGVLPPDHRLQCLREADNSLAIIVTGPPGEENLKAFRNRILPNFRMLLANLGSPPHESPPEI